MTPDAALKGYFSLTLTKSFATGETEKLTSLVFFVTSTPAVPQNAVHEKRVNVKFSTFRRFEIVVEVLPVTRLVVAVIPDSRS